MLATAAAATSLTSGCRGEGTTPYALTQVGDLSYVLETRPCAEPGDATVAESGAEVRIDAVSRGDAVDGDCNGVVHIELDAPIGDRDVFVDGEPWIRIDDGCERTMHASADESDDRPEPTPVPCDF